MDSIDYALKVAGCRGWIGRGANGRYNGNAIGTGGNDFSCIRFINSTDGHERMAAESFNFGKPGKSPGSFGISFGRCGKNRTDADIIDIKFLAFLNISPIFNR